MEWFSTLTAMISGFVLRFGVPIAVTFVVIYALRRLDERWQAEAKAESQAALASARVAEKRCWEVKGCLKECLAQCPAAALQQPCWQTFRQPNGHLRETCLRCDVFLKAPIPTSV